MARPRKKVKWYWNGKSLVLVNGNSKPLSVGERELILFFESRRKVLLQDSFKNEVVKVAENDVKRSGNVYYPNVSGGKYNGS